MKQMPRLLGCNLKYEAVFRKPGGECRFQNQAAIAVGPRRSAVEPVATGGRFGPVGAKPAISPVEFIHGDTEPQPNS
ncbi:MAG: hypothetical protein ABIQ35_09415 [Verrucomicrobiota bacterium]